MLATDSTQWKRNLDVIESQLINCRIYKTLIDFPAMPRHVITYNHLLIDRNLRINQEYNFVIPRTQMEH